MKVTAIIAVAALAASNVAAAPDASANAVAGRLKFGFCGAPGQACGKSRRAADAVAAVVAEANPNNWPATKRDARGKFGFCGVPGQACGKMRRHVEEIGDALDDVIKRDARGKFGFCGVPGQACGRSAVAEAEARGKFGFCGVPGQACGRNALPEPEAEARGKFGFCGVPGQACGKHKRAAEAINEADPELFKETCFEEGNECDIVLKAKRALDQVKRDAAAAAEASPRGKFGFCGVPGQACGREVHEYLEAAEAGDEVAKRAESDCNAPDGECTLAEADYAHLERAVNSAVEALGDL